MFVVSYVLIVAFHPALKLNRFIIQRSYGHSLEQLTSLNYFSEDQMKFIDEQIIRQLEYIAIDISKRKCKNMMGQMLCIESTLVKKALFDWFHKKYRMKYLETNAFVKMQYERNNPVNWRDMNVLCKMPLRVEPTNFKMPDDKMTYGDFAFRFEHKIRRNIYTSKHIKESNHLENLENYYEIYQKFVSILIGLLSIFNNYKKNDETHEDVSDFIEENFDDDSIDELKNRVMQTEIKNALQSSAGRVPKFNLNIYVYAYDMSRISLFSK